MIAPFVSFIIGHGQVLSLQKTGPNTAVMIENGSTYKLGNIVASVSGISCDVLEKPLLTPHIVVTWEDGPLQGHLKITISKSLVRNGSTDNPISSKDLANLKAFIVKAKFPVPSQAATAVSMTNSPD